MTKRPEQQILRLAGKSPGLDDFLIPTEDTRFIESFAGPISSGESAWIYGSMGVGKTALVTDMATKNFWAYYDCKEINQTDVARFFDALIEIDTLVLDHVDRWLLNQEVERVMFSWWKRRAGGLCLVSRQSPRAPNMFSLPDLQSRAVASLIFEIGGFDDTQCDQLFRRQIFEKDLMLSDEVIQFLQPRLPRNPGRIVQLITDIDKASLREQRKITVPWLSRFLERDS